MFIEIKTLQDIQDSRVKLEITIDPAETEDLKKALTLTTTSREFNRAKVLKQAAEIDRLTDTSEYYVRTMDGLKAKLAEIERIVNHGDVTAQLDPARAIGAWGEEGEEGEDLAKTILNVRHVLSSSPSSQA